MKIAAKLALAAKACGYVQKDGSNSFHKYRYASAAAILGHVNDALHDVGLAVVETTPEIVSVEGAGKDRVVTARMTLVVADTESDERATFRGLGSGMDSGDKAVMKAQTAALKYAWLGAFSISTGDDPEADAETDRRAGQSKGAAPKAQRESATPSAAAAKRREEAPVDGRAPAEPSGPLAGFYARLGGIELPGDAAAAWMKHRPELAEVPALEREAAWKALCKRTEEVGKMTPGAAKVWLKRALAEEDARRDATGKAAGEEAPRG